MTTIDSICVGLPRQVRWRGTTVSTGIFKARVDGPVRLRRHNLEGDRQADLSVHGGPTKAVYLYPTHHYEYWRAELGDTELAWGAFGENFTATGVDEEEVFIGDEYRVGSIRVVVTEPRMPCYKLGIRFDRADMPKRFLKSQRTGFYFGVIEEGLVEAGDCLDRVTEHPGRLSVADVTRLYTTERTNEQLLRKAIAVEALPVSWRGYFAHQLSRIQN